MIVFLKKKKRYYLTHKCTHPKKNESGENLNKERETAFHFVCTLLRERGPCLLCTTTPTNNYYCIYLYLFIVIILKGMQGNFLVVIFCVGCHSFSLF